jgi:integrase/recombinase XerD
MLDLYRRHSDDCPHAKEGRNWNRCRCPIWCAGEIDDRPLRKSVKTRDWARAARRIEQWEREPQKVSAVVGLKRAVAAYLADCETRKLKESTIDSYRNTLEQLRDSAPGVGIDSVDVDFLGQFRSGRKLEASTSVKELEILRAFCTFCVDRGWLPKNPAKKLKRPKETAPPTMPYTADEVSAILDACEELDDGNPARLAETRARASAACLVMLYSGLRISDLVKLERSTVDLDTGKMLLRVMKTGVPLYTRLGDSAVRALRSLPLRNPYFFWTGNGDLITAVKNMRRTIQRVLSIAKVTGHPHRFRDTFSVELLSQGEDIRTVQLLLGHSSLKTTEKHYAPYVKSFQKILDAATAKLSFGDLKKRTKPVNRGTIGVQQEKTA